MPEEKPSSVNSAEKDTKDVLLTTNIEQGDKSDTKKSRETWTGKLDFVMSAISFAVGMGNIWRFPYLVHRNGGGAFLIPYLVMVVLIGVPMMFLELSFGQYGRQGVVSIWKISPLFQGVGWTMFAVSAISCIYYNMLIAYSFFYMFVSLGKDVPWRNCGNKWNTPECGQSEIENQNMSIHNISKFDNSSGIPGNLTSNFSLEEHHQMSRVPKFPADEYFHNYVLGMSDGIGDLGIPQWHLALCLLLCWTLVFVCLWKGIKSQGKVTYITSLFPYIILSVLFFRGLMLDGSIDGILYYLTPKWDRLTSAKVWGDAAIQVFFSMSICWGGLITLASYNKFNNNCLRDSVVVALGDSLTAFFAGMVIFSILGYMARSLNVGVEEVVAQGAGLAFIVYPAAVTSLPVAPLLAILFMLMLINLGLGTQFTLVTTIQSTLIDVFPNIISTPLRRVLLLLSICLLGFMLGLVITTPGGMYVLQLMDSYAPSYGLLIVGLAETLIIANVYGIKRYVKNVEEMLGKPLSNFWTVCWRFVTPALIAGILLFVFIDFKRSSYGNYTYPTYAEVIGWMIPLFEVSLIPAVAIYKILSSKSNDSLWQRVCNLAKPQSDWGQHYDYHDAIQKVELELEMDIHGDLQGKDLKNNASSPTTRPLTAEEKA